MAIFLLHSYLLQQFDIHIVIFVIYMSLHLTGCNCNYVGDNDNKALLNDLNFESIVRELLSLHAKFKEDKLAG